MSSKVRELSSLPQELLDLILEFAISSDSIPRERQRERIAHAAVCRSWRLTRGIKSFKELVLSTEEQIIGFVESLRGIGEEGLGVTGVFLCMKFERTVDVTKEIQYILEKSTNATEIELSFTSKMQRRRMDPARLVIGLSGLVKLKSVKFLGGIYFEDDFLSILSLWPRLKHLDLTGLPLPLEIPPFVSPSLISLTIATDEATDLLTLLRSSATTLRYLSLELALYAYSSEEIDELEDALKFMRATSIKRIADATKSHVTDKSAFWKKVRQTLVVNPEIGTGSPIVEDHRWPQPGSRPEKFTVPSSKASDIAQNPYYLRDFRRMYPSTAILTQNELATLLIAQGGFTSLPAPASGPTGTTALTTSDAAPTLSSLYLTPATDAPLPAFKAPRPPGMKFSWAVAKEAIPHDKDAYFPMWSASSKRIA